MRKEHPRIVSLVPSWTETLFLFGFDSEVVGVTRFCVHPKELVERVEHVGGTKDPKVARIIELKPDLVVCEKEENRKEDVDALRDAGLEVWLSEVTSVDDSLRAIASLGEAVGKEDAAHALVGRIEASMRDVVAARPPEPIPVYVPIWKDPWMTIGDATYAHHVLAVAGARNVFAGAERRRADESADSSSAGSEARYPERGPDEAIEAGARAVLLPTEPYPFDRKLEDATRALLDAGFPRERIRVLDGEALTWYGAREVDGLRVVAEAVRDTARGAG